MRYRGIDRQFRERIKESDYADRIIRGPEKPSIPEAFVPGNIVQFDYTKSDVTQRYYGLVVTTKRSGARGYRKTIPGNVIVQIVELDLSLSDSAFEFVVNTLYKNHLLAKYLSIKNRSNEKDQKMINYRYLKNIGRANEVEDDESEIKESTMARRALGRENRAKLVRVLNEGKFKTFRVEKLSNLYIVSLVDEELAQ